MSKYRMCVRCVMDTTDPTIEFDDAGVCSHCRDFENITKKQWFPNEEGRQKLENIVERIKSEGQGKDYDSIIGLSGGVDSSYLMLKTKELGLRPLVVHVDAGWNSEIAVHNIERLVKYTGFDLHTVVIDWEKMKALQLAYLKSGVANQDVPQDHSFFANLYQFATKNKIRYVLNGSNISTEAIFAKSWHHSNMDSINIRAIYKRYAGQNLTGFRTISFFEYYFLFPFVHQFRILYPLNFLPYDKEQALEELKEKVGYKEYGRKHGESIFTRFFQNHYLPKKFGYDKRKLHLSSMVVTGSMTREEALQRLEEPLYDPTQLRQDKEFVARKLGITLEELEGLINSPGNNYDKYANWDSLYSMMSRGRKVVQRLLGREIRPYGSTK